MDCVRYAMRWECVIWHWWVWKWMIIMTWGRMVLRVFWRRWIRILVFWWRVLRITIHRLVVGIMWSCWLMRYNPSWPRNGMDWIWWVLWWIRMQRRLPRRWMGIIRGLLIWACVRVICRVRIGGRGWIVNREGLCLVSRRMLMVTITTITREVLLRVEGRAILVPIHCTRVRAVTSLVFIIVPIRGRWVWLAIMTAGSISISISQCRLIPRHRMEKIFERPPVRVAAREGADRASLVVVHASRKLLPSLVVHPPRTRGRLYHYLTKCPRISQQQ